ncbi:response regulator [Polaribacter sp. KT25b]|uniref:response regulator n=1 Tax=Polaribacter sp. KT25b TaxID=1855336 RepID=UPI000B854ADB|nr:response regulator [Polaribacter sp. KT25b]
MPKRNKILLIDDNYATNFYHNIIINNLDTSNEVDYCTDGIDALNYLSNKGKYKANDSYPRPDIIFLDLNMPKMNGIEFLEVYKNLSKEQKGEKLIVMLTISLNEKEKTKIKLFQDVIDIENKPITEEYLSKIITT